MKLLRFGDMDYERPGVELPGGERLDVSGFGEDFGEKFFGSGGMVRLHQWLEDKDYSLPPIPYNIRLGSPIERPSKIVCVGLNYAQHAAESGMSLPKEPVLFFKSTSAITGAYDDLIIPPGSVKTDWEVELGVVIGQRTRYVHESHVMDHIAGYILHNDYSERAYQLEHEGQWVKGKSCDTFAPLGPYLVSKDEIADPHQLRLWLRLNGEIMQESNTADMVFGIPTLVSYISRFMTLMPGDIISTGTPWGVGLGRDPSRYIRAGDVIEWGVQGLGIGRHKAIDYSA